MADQQLANYYAQRAKEYEKIYEKPERQEDLARIRQWLREELAGRNILEVACGTGYWTQFISQTAQSVLATDINPEVLEIAKSKSYPKRNVLFALNDLYALFEIQGAFDAFFGGFIWSHIPLQDLDAFIDAAHASVWPGAKLVFIDNSYVEGSSTPITGEDEFGNTYQERSLLDGSKHNILKNFPSADFIHSKLADKAEQVRLTQLDYYWLLGYESKK
jgi:demethylmenaquinone methyltransferase/2-methoxy-6-polyprenyl-1,4-benzoquinol methylase